MGNAHDTFNPAEISQAHPNEREIEDEANEFAMHLLMPTEFLKAELAKLGGFDIEDEKAVQKLAKKFGVSQQIMTLRLGQLLGIAR